MRGRYGGDMEEEIIGNRWKELDYDGYYLVSPPFSQAIPTGRSGSKVNRLRDRGLHYY